MANVTFRSATLEDIRFVGARLRKADRAEVAALGFSDPAKAVERSVRDSDFAWVGLIDGVPSMIFGVGGSLLCETGFVWALGTDNCTSHPREMLVWGRRIVRDMAGLFPVLENWCDARYTAAHRWLERIGFTLDDPAPYGPNGTLFRRIEVRRK